MSAWRGFRSVFARVVALVALAALAAATVTTLVSTTLVRDDKEAQIVEAVVERATQARAALAQRIALARAELASVALASERGLLMEVPRLVSGHVLALDCYRGDDQLVVAAADAEARRALEEIPRDAASIRLLPPDRLVVRAEANGIVARGMIDVTDVLAAAPRWTVTLSDAVASDEAAIPGGAVVARHVSGAGDQGEGLLAVAASEDGLAITVSAPLAPARRAASRVTEDVLFYSTVALLPIIAIAVWLARATTAPVRRLASAVRDVRAGPIALPPLPPDEIGDLGAAIGAMSLRLSEDARGLRAAVDFARVAGRAADADEIRAALRETLEQTILGVRFWVVGPDDARALPTDLPLGGVEVRERLGSRDPARPRSDAPAEIEEGAISTAAAPEVVIELRTSDRCEGLLVAAGALDDQSRRLLQLLARVAQSALQTIDSARKATENEKLAVLGRLAAVVTHEINNPLGSVLTNVQILEDETQGELHDAARDARESVERIARIVRDLSTLSHGGPQLERRSTDLVALVRRAVRTAAPRRSGVRLEIDTPLKVEVPCDAGRVEQVVLNLIANAMDACASRPEPVVSVSVTVEDAIARVRVRDNGCGIEARVVERLFEPFFTTKGGQGTGLGLFVSRALARAHGGDILIESTGASGTSMTLSLPAGALAGAAPEASLFPARPAAPGAVVEAGGASPAPAASAGRDVPGAGGPRPRVLVIDDEAMVVRALVRWLKPRADVVGTSAPDEAVAAAGGTPFDLVLCDCDLRETSGPALRERLVLADPRLSNRVVLMTGSAELPSTSARVLRKPWPPEVLQALLDESVVGR